MLSVAPARRLALCLMLAMGLTGCSYSTVRPFPTDIQTVHVEMFQSREFRRELEFRLTEAITKRVEIDTPYRIASRRTADTLLTGEILAVLKNIAPQVRFVRNMRDNLYRRLKAWDKIFNAWDNVIMSRSDNNEVVLRDTYRFLAPRFMKTDDWVLYSQLQEGDTSKTAMRW